MGAYVYTETTLKLRIYVQTGEATLKYREKKQKIPKK